MLRMSKFLPHLEILPPAQLRLWHELDEVPPEFTLYGGTAIALQLGHRQSVDFDFFGNRPFDPTNLQSSIPFLAKARVLQRERKDYLDLDVLITRGGITLPMALTAAQALYGAAFNPQITLKALSYFEDGNLRYLSEDAKMRLATAARDVDLDHLPGLQHLIGERARGDDLSL
jgi:hypothetical protein